MKGLLSILLLGLLMLNVMGFYGVFMGWNISNSMAARDKVANEDFGPEQTITIKIPVSLPYPIMQQGYERAEGAFEYQGKFYRLVKQKLDRDTLYVVCFDDEATAKLRSTFADYVKSFSDVTDETTSDRKHRPSFTKDYLSGLSGTVEPAQRGWRQVLVWPGLVMRNHTPYFPPIIHPPEVNLFSVS